MFFAALSALLFIVWGPHARAAALPLSRADTAPRARVVTVHDPAATDAFRPWPERVKAMLDCGITNLAGKASVPEAWRSFLFTNGVVSRDEVVGIKVYSTPGPNSGSRPATVAALIEGLLAAGLPATNILIWDRQEADLRSAGFYELAERYHVRVAGSAQAGYDEKVFYDSPLLGNLVWGDLEFGKKTENAGRKSFVSKLVTHDITIIINLTPLLNHNLAGVSGNLYSLAGGSVDNVFRFETEAGHLATALPEIYALPALGDRVVLNIVDALICQYEGGERGLLHYSTVLNELRFSRDPVALDALSVEELARQRKAASAPGPKPNPDLYNNASLLELGVSDARRIRVERIEMPGNR